MMWRLHHVSSHWTYFLSNSHHLMPWQIWCGHFCPWTVETVMGKCWMMSKYWIMTNYWIKPHIQWFIQFLLVHNLCHPCASPSCMPWQLQSTSLSPACRQSSLWGGAFTMQDRVSPSQHCSLLHSTSADHFLLALRSLSDC